MAKFVGADVVEALEYDLSTWRPDPDAPSVAEEDRERVRALAADPTWVGTIPEPRDEQIQWLFNGQLPDIRMGLIEATERAVEEARERRRAWWAETHPDESLPDLEDAAVFPAHLLREEDQHIRQAQNNATEEARARTVDVLAVFCSQQPSRDVLAALPYRALEHFTGWVTGQFRPETLAAAMTS